jgi:hypothetical protein
MLHYGVLSKPVVRKAAGPRRVCFFSAIQFCCEKCDQELRGAGDQVGGRDIT